MTTKYLGEVDGAGGASVTADFRQIQTGGNISRISKRSSKSFYVLADVADSDDTVLQSASIPAYSTSPDTTYGYLITKTAKEISTIVLAGVKKVLWVVDCQFSTEGFQYLKRRWYVEIENELRYLDEADTPIPIVTNNNEPLNPEWPVANIILEIEKMQIGAFDPDDLFDYINHVNSDTFYGAPAGTALMQDIKVDENFERAWLSSDSNVCNEIVSHIIYTIKFRIRKVSGVIQSNTLKNVKLLNEGYMVLPGDNSGPTSTVASMNPERNGQAPRCNIVASGTYAGMDLRKAQQMAGGTGLTMNDCFVTFTKFASAAFAPLTLEVCATGTSFTSTTT